MEILYCNQGGSDKIWAIEQQGDSLRILHGRKNQTLNERFAVSSPSLHVRLSGKLRKGYVRIEGEIHDRRFIEKAITIEAAIYFAILNQPSLSEILSPLRDMLAFDRHTQALIETLEKGTRQGCLTPHQGAVPLLLMMALQKALPDDVTISNETGRLICSNLLKEEQTLNFLGSTIDDCRETAERLELLAPKIDLVTLKSDVTSLFF